jgi:hypothetical protein
MSRVEEDREAARVAAKLVEQKRTEEQQKTHKAAESNAFAKLVGQQKQQGQQVAQQGSAARSAIAKLIDQAGAARGELAQSATRAGQRVVQSQEQEGVAQASVGRQELGEKVQAQTRGAGALTAAGRSADEQGSALTAQGRQGEAVGATRGSEGRRGDAATERERQAERRGSSDASASGGAAEGAGGEKGELKVDADQGGGGQQSGGKDSKDGGGAAASFRFNPALMAPVSVAKQKEASGSDRLLKIANELAQKIVERVRVGTNAAGRVEFQVDLRGDVLSGLSVRVSAHNGRIKAVFSGNDRDVLKLIEEQGEALKNALAARGLRLEEFKTEARP